jgi:hypothetical protein
MPPSLPGIGCCQGDAVSAADPWRGARLRWVLLAAFCAGWRDPALPEKSKNDDRVVLLKLKAEEDRLHVTQTARLARTVDGPRRALTVFRSERAGLL